MFYGINGGKTCEELLENSNNNHLQTESKICAGTNEFRPQMCPISPSWTFWTPWTKCSANCGPSTQQRTRSCINGRYGGAVCPQPYQIQKKNCPTKVSFFLDLSQETGSSGSPSKKQASDW